MNFALGTLFHGIKLLRYCGGGAYGEVYFGEDISGRQLAVKIVFKEKLGDVWQRELKGVVNYRHITENAPELLQIFHVEEDADTFFYTMEAADSATEDVYTPDTLAGRLAKGALPQEEIFRILSAIFAGIKCIHDAGFAHRDIKPDNILFVNGVPKLGDIGLLSSLDATLTQIAGTMDFLPPEMRAADGDELVRNISHPRNDLYAFGKVVYCAATGNGPHEWPTVPAGQKLSLPLKFFLRFSFQLCAKDPLKRLDDIGDAAAELKEIGRKLLYGETLRDKIRFVIRQTGIAVWCDFRHTLKWFVRHWLLVLFFLLAAGAATWYFWPEPPFDIAKQPFKTYRDDEIGFTMNLPQGWETLSHSTATKLLQEVLAEGDKLPEIEKKRLEVIVELLKHGGTYIFCDYDKNFADNIFIQTSPVGAEEFRKASDDELRMSIQHQFHNEFGYRTQIYEVRHCEVAGIPCVYIDLSHNPGEIRTNNYIFLFREKSMSIALTCKDATYQQRKAEFASILSSLKFDKKALDVSESPKAKK
ncbi:MAG: protein kinase [Victivallaceae bacterium]|nr:protein kinase [Victivallaceae bacterium]